MGRVGINDEFGRSGKAEELIKIFGLTASDIAKKTKDVLKNRRS